MLLSEIFASGMVFPKGKPIRVFGEGSGKAIVKFNGVTKNVYSEGKSWCVEFEPMEYGGPYEIEFNSDGQTRRIDDVYVGEVYLFSGQSNMALKLSATKTPKERYRSCDTLRLFTVSNEPDSTGWVKADVSTLEEWSSLAYLVSEELQRKKNVAIGAVLCAQGASVIESWMPEGSLKSIGIDIPIEQKHIDHVEYSEWNVDSYLYEKWLKRIIPYSFNGVVWYQGESDTAEAEGRVYGTELEKMIEVWRSDFMDDQLPFVVVQIADCEARRCLGWSLVQEAQERISERVQGVSTVISRDVCETDDIHPATKHILAERIVRAIK